MLCYVMLCYVMLCYVMLCCVVLCYFILLQSIHCICSSTHICTKLYCNSPLSVLPFNFVQPTDRCSRSVYSINCLQNHILCWLDKQIRSFSVRLCGRWRSLNPRASKTHVTLGLNFSFPYLNKSPQSPYECLHIAMRDSGSDGRSCHCKMANCRVCVEAMTSA